MEKIEMDFNDCILEKPYGFEVDGKHFYLYPVSLGKYLYLRQYVEELEADFSKGNPYEVAYNAVKAHRHAALVIIAVHTFYNGRAIFDTTARNTRIKALSACKDEDLTTLLVICLTKDNNIEAFKKHLRLDEEENRRAIVLQAKGGTENIYTFGGKSVLGTLIDATLERYHWTYQYVLWEISYSTLQMLVMDRITSIYLSDEQRKNCHVVQDSKDMVFADDPKNEALLYDFLGIDKKE